MDEVFEKLQSAVEVMVELRQFLLYRLAVYTVMGAIVLCYWMGALFLYWLLAKMMEAVATLFLLAAIAGTWGVLHVAKSYLLYTVQAGYVAVLTQALAQGIPPHVNQKDLARQMVSERFSSVAMLATVDQLVKRVLATFSKQVEDMASWVPIPGMHQVLAVLNLVIGRAVNTIDEAILSLVFVRKDQPTWETVREGLVLYAGAWKPVLKLSAGLVVLDLLCTPLLFVMLLMVVGIPSMVLFTAMPIFRGLAIVIPFVITYLVRQVLLEPMAVTAVVIAFQRAIKNQKPDPALDEQLAALSPQFAQVVAKAEVSEPAPAGAAAAAAAPAAAAPGAPAQRQRQRPGGLKKP